VGSSSRTPIIAPSAAFPSITAPGDRVAGVLARAARHRFCTLAEPASQQRRAASAAAPGDLAAAKEGAIAAPPHEDPARPLARDYAVGALPIFAQSANWRSSQGRLAAAQ